MLRWKNLHKALPAGPGAKSICEACGEVPRETVLYAVVPKSLQKAPHNQPPWRYRCETCGPTQDPFVHGPRLKAALQTEEST